MSLTQHVHASGRGRGFARALLGVRPVSQLAVLTVAIGVLAAGATAVQVPSARGASTPSGTVVAWGANYYGQTNVPYGLTGVVAISARGDHTLALKSDGTVVGWGAYGQTDVPAGLNDVVAVAAGEGHDLALKSDGSVVAWGNNDSGQASVPAGLTDVVAIAAGGGFSLALKSDGTVVAWGYWSAIEVPAGLTDVVAIAAGGAHSLALRSDGTVVAWGNNASGQTDVPGELSDVMAIAAGGGHSLALKTDGTVVGWGYNSSGQATPPAGLTDVTAIAAGLYHSLALKSDGSIVAWGENYYGEGTPPPGIYGVIALAGGSGYSVAIAAGVNDPTPRPPNDDWDGATTVTGVPFQATQNTLDATTAGDEDPFWVHKTVWFSFTPSADGRVAISRAGSDYATDAFVYTGTRDARTEVACDYPLTEVLWCNVSAGTTYHILVSARYGVGGNLVFSVRDLPRVTLTIDDRVVLGHPSSPTAVRVGGTLFCNEAMRLSYETWFIEGGFSSAVTGYMDCSPTETRWTIDVPDYGYFTPGNGTVIMSARGEGVGGWAYESVTSSVVLGRYDAVPPVITVPPDVRRSATGPTGAIVDFTVTAADANPTNPAVTCTPASGTVFPIGDTTVHCAATDAAGNTANAHFTVHVKGAAEQLADLRHAVIGVGPGSSLDDKVRQAQTYLDQHNVVAACATLSVFISQVRTQTGKSIPPYVATALISDATRIRAVLGC